MERYPAKGISNHFTQDIDMFHEQSASAIVKIDREEECAAWDAVAAIIGHCAFV